MLNIDPVGELDNQAIRLDQKKADQAIYEFDLSMWLSLKQLAQAHPKIAARQFGLSAKTIAYIAQAEQETLMLFASGVLTSFRLETNEKDILQWLAQPSDRILGLNQEERYFNTTHDAYWSLLQRAAHREWEVASVTFSISPQLAQAIAQATDNQLRYLARQEIRFTPRFHESVIQELIEDDDPTYTVLKKMLQSLANTKKN